MLLIGQLFFLPVTNHWEKKIKHWFPLNVIWAWKIKQPSFNVLISLAVHALDLLQLGPYICNICPQILSYVVFDKLNAKFLK